MGLSAMEDVKMKSIIIPYRDRAEHLEVFMREVPKYWDGNIIVVEQTEGRAFNRGKLINIGVAISNFDWYVIHDVDLIPKENVYFYPEVPTQLRPHGGKYGVEPYEFFFGGCVQTTREHFVAHNGIVNSFWGWGHEDDIWFERVRKVIGKWKFIKTDFIQIDHPGVENHEVIHAEHRKIGDDGSGLNDLEFDIRDINYKEKYLHIKVEI
jgi:hypothetical protein